METTDDSALYPVGRYSRFLVRFPAIVMAISFIASGGLSFLAINNGAFTTLFGWSDLSSIIVQQLRGFQLARLEWFIYLEDHGHGEVIDEPESDDRRRRLSHGSLDHGLASQRSTRSLSIPGSNFAGSKRDRVASGASHRRRALLEDSSGGYEPTPCPRQSVEADGLGTYLLFEDKTNDPLNPDTLESLKKAQLAVAKLSDYKAICMQNTATGDCSTTLSPVTWAAWPQPVTDASAVGRYDNDSAVWASCLQISQDVYQQNRDEECKDQFSEPVVCSTSGFSSTFPERSQMEGVFKAMCESGPGQVNEDDETCAEHLLNLRDFMFAEKWDCSSLEAKHTRIALPSAGPLDDSGNCDWWSSEEEMDAHLLAMIDPLFDIVEDVEASNKNIKMYFTNNMMTDYYLNKDLMLLGVSVVLVILVLWIYTSSLFLTFAGLFEILVSFPLGLFVWSIVLQEPGVTIIMYNGIFIILGIGCDDIFVFMDAYRQSYEQPPHISGSLETRFAWAFNRAAMAMLTTSVTTCLAFGGCAVSQVWDIRCFGIVNGFMVLFDYLLVITWFPACLVFHEKYIKANCCPTCAPTPLFLACKNLLCRMKSNKPKAQEGQEEEEEVVEQHWLEKFYEGPYANFIIQWRKGLIALFLVLTLVSTFAWTQYLKPSTKPFTFFDDDHFVTKTNNIMGKKFANVESEGMITVNLGFGVDPKNPWNQGGVHPAKLNEDLYENTPQSANYVDEFDVFEHQQGIETACAAFHAKMVELGESGSNQYFSWIEDFQQWLATTNLNGSFPFTERDAFYSAVDQWVDDFSSSDSGSQDDDDFVRVYLYNFEERNNYYWEEEDESYRDQTGYAFNKAGTMNFAFCGFVTGLEVLDDGWPNTRIWKLYDNMEEAREAAEEAGGLQGKGIQVCEEYDFMALASYLALSAFTSMLASLCIAILVILLVTRNLRLTVLASLCLYCIVSLVFGLMVASGWSINLLEAVDISIAGGMSVDYLLHMVHAFNHLGGSSQQKVRGALREMGVSVSMGVVTTFIACCALLMTEMLWFRLFGVFIIMVVLSAFFTSMVGLMALLAQLGPSSSQEGDDDSDDADGGSGSNVQQPKAQAATPSGDAFEKSEVKLSTKAKSPALELVDMSGSESEGSSERPAGSSRSRVVKV